MNGHAYEHYIDLPGAIFRGWHSPRFHETLQEAVSTAKANERALDPLTIARLRWYPSLTAEFILEDLISQSDVDRILVDPTIRFRTLCNHYEALAPMLEGKLLDDPESVERLLRWLRYKDISPNLAEADYLKRLGEDPNRAFRLTPPGERPDRERLRSDADRKKYESPGWAFLYVSCNSLATVEPRLVEVLSRSEEYAYLAAFVLRRRGMGAQVWESLLLNIRSLRWAFHVMRDLDVGTRINQTTQVRLLDIVHRSPPWAAQLWESRRWRGDQLSWAFEQCSRLASGHECMPELQSWMRMTTLMTGPRVAVAAA